MIEVKSSPSFDGATKEALIESTQNHIKDVKQAVHFFIGLLSKAAEEHDKDKLENIDAFHKYFSSNFKETDWWDKHKMERHHKVHSVKGFEDINLLDILEAIADSVTAGMARRGDFFPMEISPDTMLRALHNTAELLKKQIKVIK